MLTYFEVDPHSRFERHNHESEQITMVLKGELYFEMDERVVRVSEGEVIAIPSNVPHAVFTKELSVEAVDAWSPLMGKYDEEQG
jgi:quercetin dioxygenase-like cupin family protein